jgi:pyruvate/2-oxoglutarate dehydrogenase complex dihydrolipoamide acyltransferase (E2) component
MSSGGAGQAGYVVRPIPRGRQPVLDRLAGASRRFQVHALIELDVSRAAERIRTSSEDVSWTAFVIASVARGVALHPALNARRAGGRLVCFERVDIGAPVERGGPDHPLLDLATVRAADRMSCTEITALLHEAKVGTPPVHEAKRSMALLLRLPGPLRLAAIRAVATLPSVSAGFGPAVGVTSLGMFTQAWGWAVPFAPLTVIVAVGNVAERPAVEDGRVVARPRLPLTVTFDHAVVDGAPAARFVDTLRELVETAAVLEDAERGHVGHPGGEPQMSRKTSMVAPSALSRSARSS